MLKVLILKNKEHLRMGFKELEQNSNDNHAQSIDLKL